MNYDIQLAGFTVTSLLITAAVCLVAVLVAWYTVRSRVKFSQMILGLFCYVLVMVLENLFGNWSGTFTAGAFGAYMVLTTVLARELVRYPAMRFGIRGKFSGADSAIGFALGFAGLYLFVCAFYYFSLYSTAREYLQTGMDQFLVNSGADAESAVQLLENMAAASGWEYLATALNRVFFLVREIALCVLLWYAMDDPAERRWYVLVPVLHLLAMVPDGLYQAEILSNGIVRDLATCVISGAIAALAAMRYNQKENQAAHYRVEHLRARRRR